MHINNLVVENPWLTVQWRQPVGSVYQDDDLLTKTEIGNWSKLMEWNAVLGEHRLATGLVFYRKGVRQIALEVHYTAANENRCRRAAAELLILLAPHFLLGEQIMKLRREFPIDGHMATSLLELSSLPVIIVSSDNRVINMNARAERLANQLDVFFISAERQFHAMDMESEAACKSALHALRTGSRKVSEVITLWNGDRSRHVFMALAKLGETHPSRSFPVGRFECGDEHFALIVHDMNEELGFLPDTLCLTFRLSNAESELARRLLQGDTVGDVAFDAGVSKQTLRNQAKFDHEKDIDITTGTACLAFDQVGCCPKVVNITNGNCDEIHSSCLGGFPCTGCVCAGNPDRTGCAVCRPCGRLPEGCDVPKRPA